MKSLWTFKLGLFAVKNDKQQKRGILEICYVTSTRTSCVIMKQKKTRLIKKIKAAKYLRIWVKLKYSFFSLKEIVKMAAIGFSIITAIFAVIAIRYFIKYFKQLRLNFAFPNPGKTELTYFSIKWYYDSTNSDFVRENKDSPIIRLFRIKQRSISLFRFQNSKHFEN